MKFDDLIGEHIIIRTLHPFYTGAPGMIEVILRSVEAAGLWVESEEMSQAYSVPADSLLIFVPYSQIHSCHIRTIDADDDLEKLAGLGGS